MKLHSAPSTLQNTVTAYGDGYIEVNRVRYEHAIVFGPQGEVVRWAVDSLAEVDAPMLRQLAGLAAASASPLDFLDSPEDTPTRPADAPEILLVGTGSLPARLTGPSLAPLLAAGVGVETMDTKAAARTYNILMSEGRQVIAALLPPQGEV